ncbi:MAG: CRISPR-associated endonuclease Cas2 [Xanthomonadales bacterium]|nr:CRISPR-associated endonuclease Cas2 [Xanthomonadales bacterium]
MPASSALWLVTYDIADPRRLGRVARLLLKHGVRVQYSVFAVMARTAEIRELKTLLSTLIKPSEDDVRIYPISARGRSLLLGASMLAPDLLPQHPVFQQLRLPLEMTHTVSQKKRDTRRPPGSGKLWSTAEQALIRTGHW